MNYQERSQGGIAERLEGGILFIKHDIEHAATGQLPIHSVNVILIPVQTAALHLVEILVAFLDGIGSNVCVEVVDVMVLDSVGEWPEDWRDVEEGAALQCCFCEVPFLLALAIGRID